MIDQKQILARMRTAFQAEATDLLNELDSALLELEGQPDHPDLINRVFRAIHTIKGSGATAGFERLARFAHSVEEVFNGARDGQVAVSPALMDVALRACDLLRIFLADGDQTPGLQADAEGEIVSQLSKFTGEGRKPKHAEHIQTSCGGTSCHFHVCFRPAPEVFLSGTDPSTLLEEVCALGNAKLSAHLEDVPPFEELDPERCYVWWEIDLETDTTEDRIRDVFVFVADECGLEISSKDNVAAGTNIGGRQFDAFFCECQEHLDASEDHLLRIEQAPSPEDWSGLFRHLHSLKGACGLLLGEFSDVVPNHPLRLLHSVIHAAEDRVEKERASSSPTAATTCNVLLEAVPGMRALLGALDRNEPAQIDGVLLEKLGIGAGTNIGQPPLNAKVSTLRAVAEQCLSSIETCLKRLFSGNSDQAVRATYLRCLETLTGSCAYAKADDVASRLGDHLRLFQTAQQAGFTGQHCAALQSDLESVRAILCSEQHDQAQQASTPATEAPPAFKMRASDTNTQTIRVDQEKLDRLIRNVSELLVARGSLPVLARRLDRDFGLTDLSRDVKDSSNTISRIAEELQNTVMSLRMIPIKTVFQRFPRLVRDLARSLGKQAEVVMEGEETELDKTVIQEIGDPLVHLVRNAVDHGLESPELRGAAGKSLCGRVTLRAYNEGGYAVIEVADDGKGLNADFLKKKALEKKLLSEAEAATMTDDAALHLIFAPGFSTAASVTDVSGRGVGMDVVSSNVHKLKGRISIDTHLGSGTRFIIKIPTSLMISKGILVECGGQEFVLPMEGISDMQKLGSGQLRGCGAQRVVNTANGILPIVSLSDALGLGVSNESDTCMAVMHNGSASYGLLVNRFVSEEQVVVKPLTGGLESKGEFQGATIMGDGRVVLVLNPSQMAP